MKNSVSVLGWWEAGAGGRDLQKRGMTQEKAQKTRSLVLAPPLMRPWVSWSHGELHYLIHEHISYLHVRVITVQIRDCEPKCLEEEKSLHNTSWRFGGSSPASLLSLLFQQPPESPSQSVPSSLNSTGSGKQRIQIKPTTGNSIQFYTFGWPIKAAIFFSPTGWEQGARPAQ